MMASLLPKLRSDLIISRHETVSGSSFIVKEPDSGNFFRFGEVEHFVAQQFDGRTALDVVQKRVEENFQAELSRETLDVFIQQLEKKHFFETHEGKKEKTTKSKKRISGNVLYL